MRLVLVLPALSLLAPTYSTHLHRQLPGFPSCADDCLNNPTNLGGCSIADEQCLCKSLPYLQTTLACINAACPSSADQQTSVTGAENLCLAFGVTLTAESSAIFGGLATVSGASTTTSGNQNASTPISSAPPAATSSTGSSRKLFSSHVYVSAIVAPLVLAVSL